MSHNMSIYRRLNPRLLVKQDWAWTYYIGLICLIYISNTLPQTQGGSSMKAWGLISMRRSFGDALKNAFEETTMKNVTIDQFWSFKWRNGVQNWNLREKLSKTGPVGNFDFWSKVNAKSQSQLVQGQSQRILVRVGSGFRVGSRVEQWIRWRHPMTCRWRGWWRV